MNLSIESIKSLTQQKKNELKKLIEIAKYRWSLQGRPSQQLPKGDWQYWLIKAGRGFGKTRTGAETVRIWKENNPILLLAGRTASDARDIMIEGESGIMNISPPWDKPIFKSSTRSLHWKNGAIALIRSADEPDSFRGLQCYKAWCDELATWYYKEGDQVNDAWTQIKMGMRLGNNPQAIITTTPRNTKRLKEIIKDPLTVITGGTTYDNKDNLASIFYKEIIKMYENTRIGRQELHAELLEDTEGALWKQNTIDNTRLKELQNELKRIIIAVDPAVTAKKDSDETGIIAVGLSKDNHGYILEDLSGIYTPRQWAERVIYLYNKWQADRIVAEVNNGGDLVEANIRTVSNNVSYSPVSAYKGKYLRAEPIAALYEQNRIHHIGIFNNLENEMTTWSAADGQPSPNRLDAMVYGITYLMIKDHNFIFFG